VKWTLQVGHHLQRNDMYIFFQFPVDWRIEEPIKFKYEDGLTYRESTLIPDATFTIKNTFYFLEVDRTQSMIDNKKKINQYHYLSQTFETQYKEKPIIVFYTTTENRKKILTQYCDEMELRKLIYTKEDLR
jgi:hypothetical protein